MPRAACRTPRNLLRFAQGSMPRLTHRQHSRRAVVAHTGQDTPTALRPACLATEWNNTSTEADDG